MCQAGVEATTSDGDRPDEAYHDRAGYREIGVPGSRRGLEREDRCAEAAAAIASFGVFRRARAGADWARGVRLGPLLGPRAARPGSRCAPDPGGRREAVRPAQQAGATRTTRDAAAMCTAVGRPDMRFVAIKSV